MAVERRVDVVSGKTCSLTAGPGYCSSQIMRYSISHPERSYNATVKQVKHKQTKSWSFSDPEAKRKRRVASYKVYTVEGKVKSSFKKSIRWLKTKYIDIRYGWW